MTAVIQTTSYNRSGGTWATLPCNNDPSGVVANDLLLVIGLAHSTNTDGWQNTPVGWTERANFGSALGIALCVYSRIATGDSNDENPEIDIQGSNSHMQAWTLRIDGHHPTNFWDSESAVFANVNNTLTLDINIFPSSVDGCKILTLFGSDGTDVMPYSMDGNGGWGIVSDEDDRAPDSSTQTGVGGGYITYDQTTAGNIDNLELTQSLADGFAAFAFAIAPAEAGANPSTLSFPNASAGGETEIAASVSTDIVGGTLYAYPSLSDTPPIAATIKADGQQFPVTVTGLQNITVTSAPGMSWFVHFLQDNGAGDSNIVNSDPAVTLPNAFTESAIYSGVQIPNTSILHYLESTHDGGDNQAVFSNSSLGLVVDGFVDLIIENRTDVSEANITANDATSITGVLSGGTDDDWDDADEADTVANVVTGDVMYCEAQANVASDEAVIKWYLNEGADPDNYSVGYVQTIGADGAPEGVYTVTLATDGSVTLTPVSSGSIPNLTNPTVTAVGETVATGTVTTNKSDGLLFALTSVNSVEVADDITVDGDQQTVLASGVQDVNIVGLERGVTYYTHYVHENSFGDSNVVRSDAFTTEFPIAVLTNPLGSAVNTTASGSVDTDQGGGVLYYLLDLNATSTPAAIKAGRSKVVTAVGIQNVNWGGNPPNSGPFFFHFLQVTTGDSNDVDTAGFFTGDLPPYATLMDAILGVTGGPTINDGLASWYGMTASETLNDAEYRWLIEQGATPASVNDMWFELLRAAGYTGAMNDMLFQYWVNGGAFPVAVPDVVGMTQVAATAAITGAGFVLGTVTGTVDPVISQVPAAGVLANPGTDVDITMTS